MISSRLYLIEILHQTTTSACRMLRLQSCILSKFYIKPQQEGMNYVPSRRCILSKFYIKPQPDVATKIRSHRCILSKFYIKPQLVGLNPINGKVVSYRNSTSNHNYSHHVTTTIALYLIEILHQTTTIHDTCQIGKTLYLIEILHQTTTTEAVTTSDS